LPQSRPKNLAYNAPGERLRDEGNVMAGAWASLRAGAGVAALAAVAVMAACQTGPKSVLDSVPPVEREFALAAVTWDLNKDGDVTCDEWKRYVTGLFREADANRDGILTREEFAVLARRDRLFETVGLDYFDANADGRLSLPEMVDKPNPAFTLLDKNRDCILTPDERVSTRAPREEGPREKGMPPPSGRPGGNR
jgi:EF hand